MELTAGNKVVYPGQGPCLIGPVVKRVVENRPMMFFQLLILKGSMAELFVPVDKIDTVGVRPLLEKFKIPMLFDQLTEPAQLCDDSRQRARESLQRLASGAPFDLVEVIKSLTDLKEIKPLSIKERNALERARMLLVCEIAEVMRETKAVVEEKLDSALGARKKTTPPISQERRRSSNHD